MKKKWFIGLAVLACLALGLVTLVPANSTPGPALPPNCATVWANTYAICSNAPSQGPCLDCMNEALCVLVSDYAVCDCQYSGNPAAAVACSTAAAQRRAAANQICKRDYCFPIPPL